MIATFTLHPEEPACSDRVGHDWQSPHAIVGGLKENPGVWGNGDGVRINECCMHCYCRRITDTTQRPYTGERRTSIIYEPGYYAEQVENRC